MHEAYPMDSLDSKIKNSIRVHKLKILDIYHSAIISGTKQFEVRLNDRNYKVGDIIEFDVINDNNITLYQPDIKYMITYILKDFIGLKTGYIVFGIAPYTV